jgi:hypothetical protein
VGCGVAVAVGATEVFVAIGPIVEAALANVLADREGVLAPVSPMRATRVAVMISAITALLCRDTGQTSCGTAWCLHRERVM